MADPHLPSGSPSPDPGRDTALALALAAVDALAALGETIDDEWTYVMALAEAGRVRLRAAARDEAAAPLRGDRQAAVVEACAEAARITDPHRAIDWLSTLPAVVELALTAPTGAGERREG